jgi:hypothetical protein
MDHHHIFRPSQDHPRFRGVNYEKGKGVWRARLYCKGQHTTLGRHPTAEQAARAHDEAAVFVLGDRAPTNFGCASYDAAKLERLFLGGVIRKRRPVLRLLALREAVHQEQKAAPAIIPDGRQAHAMRLVAAAAALFTHTSPCQGRLLAPPGGVGRATNAPEDVAGRHGGSSQLALRGKDARLSLETDALTVLVLTAVRSAGKLPTGCLN